jgi:hypothetical protein
MLHHFYQTTCPHYYSLRSLKAQPLRCPLERWLAAYTAYYNYHRSHQALDNQPPAEALKRESSIQQCLLDIAIGFSTGATSSRELSYHIEYVVTKSSLPGYSSLWILKIRQH